MTSAKALLCLVSLSAAATSRAFVSPAGAAAATRACSSGRRAITPRMHAQEQPQPVVALRSDDEREGRKLGNPRAFEYLVEYPCEFQIKVVGHNKGNFADDIVGLVSGVCEVQADAVTYTTRETGSGAYTSITLMAPVSSAEMLYKCYEVIGTDARVKFKF